MKMRKACLQTCVSGSVLVYAAAHGEHIRRLCVKEGWRYACWTGWPGWPEANEIFSSASRAMEVRPEHTGRELTSTEAMRTASNLVIAHRPPQHQKPLLCGRSPLYFCEKKGKDSLRGENWGRNWGRVEVAANFFLDSFWAVHLMKF